jgi:formate dehydrogenase major subunit
MSNFFSGWPVFRQIRAGTWRGTGSEAMTERIKRLSPKHDNANVSRSICPYCGVGCGQLVFHKEGRLVSIESPISRGRLCPKGADIYQLHTHPGHLPKVKYRGPYSRRREEIPLKTATDASAGRIGQTRERTFVEQGGKAAMHTLGMAYLGGATFDVEKKLSDPRGVHRWARHDLH